MPNYPDDPDDPAPPHPDTSREQGTLTPPTASSTLRALPFERRATDPPAPVSPDVERGRSPVEPTRTRPTAERDPLGATLNEILEGLRQERRTQQTDRATAERSLQSLQAAAQRVESLVTSTRDSLTNLIERETATVTAARRQLWDEAARFKREVRREIRWFLRAPLIALFLLILGLGVVWMHRQPADDSTDGPPMSPPAQRLERRR